jgi:hypothetical protein
VPAVRPLPFDADRLRLAARSAAADPALRLGLAIDVLANLVTYLYVWRAIGSLPELMPLHYNGAGVVDLIGRPVELLRLPAIGTLVLAANLLVGLALHRGERPAAQMLIWVGLAVQVVIGSGAWVLVTKAAGE